MPRDYYEILGVTKNADEDAIKKAYRKLAKLYHPDVNKAPDAKAKFQEIQEAYDAINDPEKRKLYDEYGHAGPRAGAGAGGGADPTGGFRRYSTNAGAGGFDFRGAGPDVDLNDVFSQFFGASRRGFEGAGQASGAGGAAGQQANNRRGKPSRGADIEHTHTISFDQAARGAAVTLQLTGPTGVETIEVKVPKGTADGAKLRVRGKGNPGPGRRPGGDLILTIRVGPHPYFRREGLDLYLDAPISIDEALFGATVEIPTYESRAQLKIPAGAHDGQKLRLRGAGLEDVSGGRGDLYAVLKVDIPRDLTESQRALLETLRGKLPNPRKNMPW